MSKVSIVTVTYNSSGLLERYLNSLILNRSKIDDVIIIENNSHDQRITKSLCTKYKNQLKISYKLNDNVGFGKSCNLGASFVHSENILFLNPDTELQSNTLEILLQHQEDNKADIVGGIAYDYKGRPHGSAVRIPSLFTGLFEFSNLGKLLNLNFAHEKFYYSDINIYKSSHDVLVDAVSGAFLMITRNAFDQLKGFDEEYFMYLEDVDLGRRAKKLNMKIVFCPHSKIFHIGGASSDNKYKIKHQAWFDSRKLYFKKHGNIFSNILIQPIFSLEESILKLIKKL